VDADVVTKFIGLIGMPLGHSTSPVFQQAALDHCGVDAFYELWETEIEELPVAVDRVREEDCLGANVTPPQGARPRFPGRTDPRQAHRRREHHRQPRRTLRGHNTDILGLVQALPPRFGLDPRGRTPSSWAPAARAHRLALIDSGRHRSP
jgi:shikimate dehydrogenase